MAKYHYNKKCLKGLSVRPFLGQVGLRNHHIKKASDKLTPFDYPTNKLAEALHPDHQMAKVNMALESNGAKSFVLIPDNNKELAYFRAGQYVTVDVKVGKNMVSRPYSLCSTPKSTIGKDSHYVIMVKDNKNKGFASKEIIKNWRVGTKVKLSGPLGNFYYDPLRDAKHVVAVAGGSGITPFISMGEAIADGTEDFQLTIIYGAKNRESIIFAEELGALARCKKIKVVYVLEDRDGFITSNIIKKYVKGDFSLFVCGPKGLYRAMDKVAAELKLSPRRYRKEVYGEYGDPTGDADYPKAMKGKRFKLTVIMRDKKYNLSCHSNETLLNAMEKGGVHAPSHCRSGECGWCHSLLVSGKVYIPKAVDGRRLADVTFNWIHPCASYPLSDIVLEVPYNK